MVECFIPLDLVFHSLADATRRDMLRRLSRAEQTISALAAPYAVSLAAIAKHIGVLEKAGLVTKERTGKEKVVRLVPGTLKAAEAHFSEYEKLWAARYDALEALLADQSTPQSRGKRLWQRSRSMPPKPRKT
jgi:DNA-binding transcriptional ArsR family regulator